jgi:DNA-binding response OmpR family regulator
MAKIIISEDDASTRMLVAAVLRKDGHEIREFVDGQAALEAGLADPPDVFVSDVQMPKLDGLGLVAALRADERTADIPVVLLTSLAERADMRAGMTSGADDYITKPFQPFDLQEAVSAQLARKATRAALNAMATEKALSDQSHDLERMFAERMGDAYSTQISEADLEPDQRLAHATLLYVEIASYATMTQKLSATETSAVIKKFYGFASDTINLFSAKSVQFEGSSLHAVFSGDQDTHTVTHGLRAVRAALGLLDAEARVNATLETEFGGRAAPPLRINLALDTGGVTITHVKDALGTGRSHGVVVGEPVSLTKALASEGAARGWRIAATVATMRTVMGAVRPGARALVSLAGRPTLDVGEIKGMAQ